MAVLDARGRLLDISIIFGGSSADSVAFHASDLYKRLLGGLLSDGYVLFGDNAFINSKFMATPYPNVSGGSKDNYNFFHSQLRIRVECAFGMLVEHWGILRMAMPSNITIDKTTALVNALARIHNFCIDEVDKGGPTWHDEEYLLPHDENNIINSVNGYVLPVGFGHHGINQNFHRFTEPGDGDGPLPREIMHDLVVESHCVRPRSNINRMTAELSTN